MSRGGVLNKARISWRSTALNMVQFEAHGPAPGCGARFPSGQPAVLDELLVDGGGCTRMAQPMWMWYMAL